METPQKQFKIHLKLHGIPQNVLNALEKSCVNSSTENKMEDNETLKLLGIL